jgi:anti-anti-sigma factor
MSMQAIACPACGLEVGVWSDSNEPAAGELICPGCGHGNWYRVEPVGNVQIVHLQGRGIVTEQNVMRVLERVRELIGNHKCSHVLLNFEGVNYLSSTILARLINLARFALDQNAKLKLCGLRPDVEDIFRITRLEGFFEMYPSQEAAIGAF